MMLLTGSKKETTLKFYEGAGYNSSDKTAFIQWLDQCSALQITGPNNLPEFRPASSEKLGIARYAGAFLLSRTEIHSAFLVQLIFERCTSTKFFYELCGDIVNISDTFFR